MELLVEQSRTAQSARRLCRLEGFSRVQIVQTGTEYQWPEREVNQLPSNAEDKNQWIYTSSRAAIAQSV
jgi:hypothetical protein